MALPDVRHGIDFGEILAEALGIPPEQTARIIIDCPCDGPVKAYVEMYASNKVLEIDWAVLGHAEIKILDKDT